MRDLLDFALNICRNLGVSYADIRIVTIKDEDLTIKLGSIAVMELKKEIGFGIRCLADGGWGFVSSYHLSKKEMQRVTELAVKIIKASGSTRNKPVELVGGKAEILLPLS